MIERAGVAAKIVFKGASEHAAPCAAAIELHRRQLASPAACRPSPGEG